MSIEHFTATVISFAALSLSAASAAEIYTGEPLGEALHDLARAATLVSHELSSGSPLLRTDVFRLADGRLIAISSRATKLGMPFSIETLRVTTSAKSRLSKRLPTIASVDISK